MHPTDRRRLTGRLLFVATLFVVMTVSLPLISAQGSETETGEDRARPTLAGPPVDATPIQPTAEITPIATEASVDNDVLASFSEDFNNLSASSSNWSIVGWDAVSDDGTTYLATDLAGAVATVDNFVQQDLSIRTNVRIERNNTATISFRVRADSAYRVVLSNNGSSRLYRNSELLASYNMPSSPVIGIPNQAFWNTVEITAANNTIAVVVNGQPSITYRDTVALGRGQVSFSSGSSNTGFVHIDSVSLQAINPNDAQIAEAPTPTPTSDRPSIGAPPNVARERDGIAIPARTSIMADSLVEALAIYESDGEQQALALLEQQGYYITDDRNILLTLSPAQDIALADVRQQVETAGASIYSTTDSQIEIFARLDAIQQLGNSTILSAIAQVQAGISSSSAIGIDGIAADFSGIVSTIGFDTISANDWHNAGVTGSGVRVGVIDVGFNGTASGDEYACLVERVGQERGSDIGLNIVEVLCDVAPDSDVYTFEAITYNALYDALVEARNLNVDVLVIGADYGVTASPGDGFGRPLDTTNNPYDLLADMRQEGRAIFVAAGNNGTSDFTAVDFDPTTRVSRQFALSWLNPDVSGSVREDTVRVRVRASAGDTIQIAWNDWAGLGTSIYNEDTNTFTLEDFEITLRDLDGNIVEPLDNNPYIPARETVFDTPTVAFTVPEDTGAGSSTPDASCEIQLNSPSDTVGPSSCLLDVFITRKRGDADVVMQMQVIPRQLELRFVLDPISEEQGINVTFEDIEFTDSANTLASLLPNTGTIGRPADSRDVIAVGSACPTEGTRIPTLPDTSEGPIYGLNGTAPTISETDLIKPAFVGPGQVSTSLETLSDPNACDGTIAGSSAGGGFYGTAVSAAHSAGMAALLRANPSMSGSFPDNAIGVDTLRNYMQGRTVDLPLDAPDGADSLYGYGLTKLGAPQFPLANSYNTTFEPDALGTCTLGDTIFAGQGRFTGTPDGTQSNPYRSIAQAVSIAATDGTINCVVVMPGEYVTPIYLDQDNVSLLSLNDVTNITFPQSIIHVAGMYDAGDYTASIGYQTASGIERPTFANRAGLYIEDATNLIVSGFSFTPSSVHDSTLFGTRRPVMMFNSDNSTLNNSTFGASSIDATSYSAWGIGQTPITVITGTGNTFEGNRFLNNTGGYVGTQQSTPSIMFVEGTNTSAMVFRNNRIENNTAINAGAVTQDQFWPTLAYALNTDVAFVSNIVLSNTAGTLFTSVTNGTTTPDTVRLVSNIFQNNTLQAQTETGTAIPSGPIAHAYYTFDLTFSNNNVVVNDLGNSGAFAAVVARGDRSPTTVTSNNDGSFTGSNQQFDLNNNLIYNNTMSAGVYTDPSVSFSFCDSLVGSTNQATGNNWFNASGSLGSCSTAMNSNGNVLSDPSNEFLGSTSTSLSPTLDPQYYALRFFQINVQYSTGMDYSDIDLSNVGGGSDSYSTYPYNIDARGDGRVIDIDNWEDGNQTDTGTLLYDVGAYEFDILDIIDTSTRSGFEDDPVISIDMREVVRGGIGDLSYEILTAPANYGTQCGPTFGGGGANPPGVETSSNFIRYCPPPDFYTTTGQPPIPENVQIGFRASDQGGLSVDGTLTIEVQSDEFTARGADPGLTEAIGDDQPLGDIFSVIADIGSTVNIRLRPYVDFGNFVFSERTNPNFVVNGRFMVEYPYSYGNVNVVSGDTSIINSITPSGDTLQVDLNDFTGEVTVSYTATDRLGNQTTNFVKIRAISRIPVNPGMYDDSTYVFEYYNRNSMTDGWQAVVSESSINNTLHTSTSENDVASFGFRGTSFTLYMVGDGRRGDFFDLMIDQDQSGNPQAITGWTETNGIYTATYQPDPGNPSVEFTCTTTSVATDNNSNLSLTNRTNGAYTISCDSTEDDVHIIEVVNRNGGTLNVDAFSLVKDPAGTATGPFTPGRYDVTHPEMLNIFTNGWTRTEDRRFYSNGVSYTATNGQPDPITFTVQGTVGFGIETMLDNNTGTYRICVTDITPVTGTQLSTCQTYDNAPDARQRPTPGSFRTFYGLDPDPTKVYEVRIDNVQAGGGRGIVIDSLVVFNPTLEPSQLLVGDTEVDQRAAFALGEGNEDSWSLSTIDRLSLEGSVYELNRRDSQVGPFVAFHTPPAVDTVYYSYRNLRPPPQALVCVDRAAGVAQADLDNSYGNCIQVDLTNGTYNQINADGTLGSGGNIQAVDGTIAISESNFREAWAGTSEHIFEISALQTGFFTLDKLLAVGSNLPLTPGTYQEYTASLNYLKADGTTPATINTSTSGRTSDYTGDFTQITGPQTRRDGAGGVMYAGEIGTYITFNFEGAGFAPRFRAQRAGAAMRACWLAYDASPASLTDVLTNGSCQILDTESIRPSFDAPIRIVGLPYDTYSVVMEYIGDDFRPQGNRFGQELYFDGVTIFGDDLTVDDPNQPDDLALLPLNAGQTYEGNYDARLSNNTFAYYGDRWATRTGQQYSNGDYDLLRQNVVGATIAFRVNDANAITYTRPLRPNYADVVICATDETDPNRRYCSIIDNDGRTLRGDTNIYLSADGSVGDYIVTIRATEELQFAFDAVQPLSISAPLTEGLYQESHPGIRYNFAGGNLILNGDMETGNIAPYWTSVNGAPVTAQSSAQSYTNRNSWNVQTNTSGQGLQSYPFDLRDNRSYTALGRVYIETVSGGPIEMQVVDSGGTVISAFTPPSTSDTGIWVTLRQTFSLPDGVTYSDARLRFVANGASTFYIDDVHLLSGGSWQVENRPNYNGGAVAVSQTNGADVSFNFTGTGFAVGLHQDRDAGEVNICYLLYSGAVPSNGEVLNTGTCASFPQEDRRPNFDTLRTITGLPFGTYKVVVKDDEDGYTVTGRSYPDVRNSRFTVGQIHLDFVRIFNNDAPVITEGGLYNEDYTINGRSALLLEPATRWGVTTGRLASNASEESYVSVVDQNNRTSRTITGPSASLNLRIADGEQATLVIDTLTANRLATSQLLVCVGTVEGQLAYNGTGYDVVDNNGATNCLISDEAPESRFLTFNSGNLPLLANNTGNAVTRNVSLQSLTNGQLEIDGYQVVLDTDLTPGFYEDTIGGSLLATTSGTWATEASPLYSSNSGFVTRSASATATTTFQGSGISITSATVPDGGEITLNVTDGNTINVTKTLNMSEISARIYGTSVTIAGLPYDPSNPTTYTATITAANDNNEFVLIDGVEVYGEPRELGSLYDDAQVDADDAPLILYGPSNNSWEALSGAQASGALNQTLHVANFGGAVATFEIGADPSKQARGITLYYDSRTQAPSVEVCFRDLANTANETCETVTTNDNQGVKEVLAPALGNYLVTIEHTTPNASFYLDAVQILESTLAEGIHSAETINSVGTLGGGASLAGDGSTINLNGAGQFVEFDMSGIGLSFVVAGGSANDYDLCISEQGLTDCGIAQTTLPDNDTVLANDNAISFVGLHADDGTERTVTVRLTNNAAGNLQIGAVHILGNNPTLRLTNTERYENDDPELRYLPFGSLTELDDRLNRPSNGSEHTGTVQGSLAYFEFDRLSPTGATGFEYFHSEDPGNSTVEVCYGTIDDTKNGTQTSADARANNQCQTIAINDDGRGLYQIAETITTQSNDCDGGCWASVRSRSAGQITLDYVRLFNANAPLEAGYYEESYTGLQFNDPNNIGSGWEDVQQQRASGSFVKRFVTPDNAPITNYNGPVMSYLMRGTGTSVYFTIDRTADAVRICVTPYNGSETFEDALNGQCQTFDNENRRPAFTAARTVAGLPFDDYVVAVQVLADNQHPAPHDARTSPITTEIDAVRVYGAEADWSDLDVITPGRQIEPNFSSRDALNQLVYYGDSWSTVTGGRARNFSNGDYDTVREYGAGVSFRTQGADAIVLYTDLNRRYAPVRICATPLNANETNITGTVQCRDYSLNGRGAQQPLVFHLAEFGSIPVSNHAVTITTLDNNSFNLDAIEAVNTGTLMPGVYNGTATDLILPAGYEQLVVNGQMESDRNWSTVGPDASITFTESAAFQGSTGYSVSSNQQGDGIESARFELTHTGLYTAQARVRVNSGAIRLKLTQGGDFNSIAEFNETTLGTTNGEWDTIRVDFTLPPGTTYEDYADIANSGLALQVVADGAGGTSFDIDDVRVIYGGEWEIETSPRAFDQDILRSTTTGAALYFSFEGTGFQIGTAVGRFEGEVEICYDDDATFGETSETNDPQSCFTYQNEGLRPTLDTSRTIVGLPEGTYYVRVHDVDDGLTITDRRNPNAVRNPRFPVGQIGIDYVRIFGDYPDVVTPPGYYNDGATNRDGEDYLQVFPENLWSQLFSRRFYSEGTYLSPIAPNGRASRFSAGQAALLNIDVPDDGATVIFSVGPVTRANPQEILICAGDTTDGEISWDGDYQLQSDDCVLRDATTTSELIVTPSDLTALNTAGITRVQITNLTPGTFTIDGYQVITSNTLAPGVYDNTLPDNLLDFDAGTEELVNEDRRCDTSAFWCDVKTARAFNQSFASTSQLGATLEFNINGSGFSVMTEVGRGTDMRICYTPTPLDDSDVIFPTRQQTLDADGNVIWDNSTQNLTAGGIWCDVFTTDTNPRSEHPWEDRNGDRPNPRRGSPYGFSYYGLPNGLYTVQVMMVDTSINRDSLSIDTIAVFDNRREIPLLPSGFYDDSNTSINYEPGISWDETTNTRNGPPRGPFNQTEHTTRNAGAISQMRVEGNAVTLYQTMNNRNSSNVRMCVIITGDTIHCTDDANTTAQRVREDDLGGSLPSYALAVEMANFSQRARRSYFTPILFYGLGAGEHEIIFENRDHGATFSLDALMVHD